MSWLAGYRYRKKIPITGSAGAGTDYKVPLTVYKDRRWVSPTGFNDPDTQWVLEERAYDDDVETYAASSPGTASYLELTLTTPIITDRIRINGFLFLAPDTYDLECEIDLYYDSDWHNIFAGTIPQDTWTEKANPAGLKTVSKARIKGTAGGSYVTNINEFEFEGEETNGIVTLGDYCTDFPNDIRLTDDDGSTELNHDIIGADADLAKFLVEIADDLGSNQSFYIYFGKSGAGSGCSEFKEDYLDYTEVDVVADHVQRTGDPSHHIDFQAEGDEDVYIYADKTSMTDFEHFVKVKLVSTDVDYAAGIPWMLSDDVDDVIGLMGAGKKFIYLWAGRQPGPTYRFSLREYNGSTTDSANYDSIALNTDYWLVFKKVGTALTCKIYSDVTLETPVDTLSVTLDEDYDFQYLFAANTRNAGASRTAVLDIDDLYLRVIVDPEPVVGTPGSQEVNPVIIAHHYKMMRES